MRIILDTSVFWHPAALRQLVPRAQALILPAVAFMERARQLAQRGVPLATFAATLERMGIEIEGFGPEEATRFAVSIHDDRAWRRLSRDAMIAGHVRPGDVIWTSNPRDFAAVGLPPESIIVID